MSEKTRELGQESAFPNQYYDGDELYCDEKGLTKREFIAVKIMASIAWNTTDRNQEQHYKHAASSSVKMADSLLKELSND